jgi:hypothetical protein
MVDRVLSSSAAPSVTLSMLAALVLPTRCPAGPWMLAKGTCGYSLARRIGERGAEPFESGQTRIARNSGAR